MFGALLEMEGRQPKYSGDKVKPGDAKSVLIEWRLGDGHRRVISGDLRAETISSTSSGRE